MATPRTLRIRKFLNLPGHGEGAFVFCLVERDGSGYVKLASCDRISRIHWPPPERPRDAKNALHKLDVLINALQRVRDRVEAQARANGIDV